MERSRPRLRRKDLRKCEARNGCVRARFSVSGEPRVAQPPGPPTRAGVARGGVEVPSAVHGTLNV